MNTVTSTADGCPTHARLWRLLSLESGLWELFSLLPDSSEGGVELYISPVFSSDRESNEPDCLDLANCLVSTTLIAQSQS